MRVGREGRGGSSEVLGGMGGVGGVGGGGKMSTLDYLVTKMRRHVRSPSSDVSTPVRTPDVEDEVELRVSEDEGAVEAEDATLPQPHHRPPVYNTEDYTTALAKYARAHNLYMPDPPKDKKGRSREKEKGGSREATPEMSLKQFSSLPELLKRLRDDLKISYLSFVKELVGDPNDCVTLLLDVLKMVQLAQTDLNGTASSREQQAALRRALIDEHECLSCLRYCLRCSDAALKLAHYHPGLYTLAVATMSNLARSRTLALQLLTRSCQTNAAGHRQVVEALATLRLRFSEPVRCKFLVSMMHSHPHNNFQVWALRFLNALVSSAGGLRAKIYLQEELAEAGFDPVALKKSIERSGSDSLVQTALQELQKWNEQYIDVETLEDEVHSARESNIQLQEELQKLRQANMKLLEENILLKTVGREVEERSAALQRRLEANGLPAAPSPVPSTTDSDLSSLNTFRNTQHHSSASPSRNERFISSSLAESVSSSQDERSISPAWTVELVHRNKSSEILKGSSGKSSSGESSQASTRPNSVSVTPTKSINGRQSSSASSTPEPKNSKSSSGYVSPMRSRTASPITNGDFFVESSHVNVHTKRSPSIKDNEHRRHIVEDRYNEHMPKNDINMTFHKENKPPAGQGLLSPRSTSPPEESHEPMKKSRSNSRLRQQVPEEPPPLNIIPQVHGKEMKHKNYSPTHINERSSERSNQTSSSQTSSATQTPSPQPSTPSTLKRKAPRPPSSKSASSMSSSTSSLSSSSSATSSGGGGERKESKDPEYMNVPRRDLSIDKFTRSSDDNDLDYERDVVVYEAITVANDRFFLDKTNTQDSRGSEKSQSSTESKNSSNKSSSNKSSSSNRSNNSRSTSNKSSSSKNNINRRNSNKANDRGDSNNNKDVPEDGPNVKESVRHYENLVVMTDQNGKDIRIEGINIERGNEDRIVMKPLKSGRKDLREDVSEREVEAVMNGFENVIRSAESSLSIASQETVKENPLQDKRFEDRASPEHQITEEIEIVPTRLPQLPVRPRSRNSQGGNLSDPILYLEFESPAETSDTESVLRSSQPLPSPRTIETESTKSFGFVRPERSLRRRETFTDKSISGQESRGSRGVRRSESFQMGNTNDYNSHRSYSPRRRGSMDLLVQGEEREVQINGKTYTKYTPHEVERRNRKNELLTRELNRQKINRSMEDRLDQWFESQGDTEWTLKWKYPEIDENKEYNNENENRRKNDNKSPTRKENNKKSKSKRPESKSPNRSLQDISHSPVYNDIPGPPAKPSRTGKPKKFTNAEISAFNGFKNPNGFRESDYGPNFMLNKPNSRLAGEYSEYADYGGRDYPLPHSRNGRGEKASRRRSELIDPAIPSPDYSATPVNTMSTIANAKSPSKHILDMPSGLY